MLSSSKREIVEKCQRIRNVLLARSRYAKSSVNISEEVDDAVLFNFFFGFCRVLTILKKNPDSNLLLSTGICTAFALHSGNVVMVIVVMVML